MTLETLNLTKSFGGLCAVNGVSFTASTGELTCITGPNGAGKTTVFNLLTGFYAPDAGRVLLDGRDITGLSPAARAREGVTRTFQNIRLLDELSALDNLTTAMHGELNGSLYRHSAAHAQAQPALAQAQTFAREQHAFFRAGGIRRYARGQDALRRAQVAGDRARCSCMKPRLMLLDEPASGLNIVRRSSWSNDTEAE